MKVYVVIGDWSDSYGEHTSYLYGVFSTSEKANQIASTLIEIMDGRGSEEITVKEATLDIPTEYYYDAFDLYKD